MMKLLTVPAFLGSLALVKADYTAFHFLNRTIPETVPVGTEIDLEWTSKDYTGAFNLSVYAFNTTPYDYIPGPYGHQPLYDGRIVELAEIPSAAGGRYVWIAEPVDDAGTWTGPAFLYQIDADLPNMGSASAGAFYLA